MAGRPKMPEGLAIDRGACIADGNRVFDRPRRARGRARPRGPDDVCLNTWLVELCRAVNVLAHSPSEYVFDEGEQGQPAFKFERHGPEVVFSIVESALSDGSADADWQGVRFSYDEFRAAVVAFLDQLRSLLHAQASQDVDRWWPKDASVDTPTP
jgi:hypothetical protein